MITRRAIACAGLTAVAGCYEVNQTENGRTYRVNQITGDVDEIVDGRLVRAKTPAQLDHERANRSAEEIQLATRRDWTPATVPIDGGTEISLATKFDTSMLYVLRANKDWRSRPGRLLSSIVLEMQDDDGFAIGSTRIMLSDMIGLVGEDQITAVALEHRGRIVMTADQYQQVTRYSVTWAGFD